MNRICRVSVLVAILLWVCCPAVADEAKPIQRLDWLIGDWTFADEQLAGDYRESGTRSCVWALGGDYIRCESQGTSHSGNERSYVWYFNYNRLDERFEITGMFEGFPRKILHLMEISEDNHRLELTYGGWEAQGINYESHAIVTYDGAGRYTWESHSPHEGDEAGPFEVRFRDTVTRVE